MAWMARYIEPSPVTKISLFYLLSLSLIACAAPTVMPVPRLTLQKMALFHIMTS